MNNVTFYQKPLKAKSINFKDSISEQALYKADIKLLKIAITNKLNDIGLEYKEILVQEPNSLPSPTPLTNKQLLNIITKLKVSIIGIPNNHLILLKLIYPDLYSYK